MTEVFKKGESRFLPAAQALLLGQIMVGVVYFLIVTVQMLTMTKGIVEDEEWTRTLTVVMVGVGLFWGLKRWPQVFDLKLTRAEKIFKIVTLGVFDVAICMAISYLLSLPMADSDLSRRAVIHSLEESAILAGVNLGMFLVGPRLKIFRQNVSGKLDLVVLVLVLGFGWNLVWLGRTLLEGPDGLSEMTRVVFDQQLVRSGIAGIILALGLGVLSIRGRLVERKAGLINRRLKKMVHREAKALEAAAYRAHRDAMRLESKIRQARRRMAGVKKAAR